MKLLFLLIVSFIAIQLSLAQAPSGSRTRLNNLFKEKTTIEDPFGLRDPFRAPMIRSDRRQGRSDKAVIRDGAFTNINPVNVGNLDSLRVVGVMVGKERRALVKVDGREEVMVLREGMRIGNDNAELKAIHPGGIIMVEKLVNVYGEEEYLETVIPISQ
jgi:Tfp pilus assembly protein PilP